VRGGEGGGGSARGASFVWWDGTHEEAGWRVPCLADVSFVPEDPVEKNRK
jgi:hypothetical protein